MHCFARLLQVMLAGLEFENLRCGLGPCFLLVKIFYQTLSNHMYIIYSAGKMLERRLHWAAAVWRQLKQATFEDSDDEDQVQTFGSQWSSKRGAG